MRPRFSFLFFSETANASVLTVKYSGGYVITLGCMGENGNICRWHHEGKCTTILHINTAAW